MLALRWGRASRQGKQSRSLESSKTRVFPPGSVQHRSFLMAGRSPLPYFSLVHATLSEPRSSTSGSWMLSAAAPNTTAGWTLNQHGLSDFARLREEFLRLIFTDQCLPQPKPGFSPYLFAYLQVHTQAGIWTQHWCQRARACCGTGELRTLLQRGCSGRLEVDVISQLRMGSQIACCGKQAV